MKSNDNKSGVIAILSLTVMLCLAFHAELHAQGTAFTYQGQLTVGGAPARGSYDLNLALFDAVTGGTQHGTTVTASAVGVTNGLFTLLLDFGGQFNGDARWLAISVKTNGGAGFIALVPRQPLTPAPYAIYAPTAGTASVAASVAAGSVTGAALADNSITAAKLASDAGSLSKVTAGTMTMNGDSPQLNSHDLLVKNDDKHGLGYYGGAKLFGGVGVDGPVLYGYSGGGLGTKTYTASNLALVWNNLGNVGIGTPNPAAKLDVFDGSYHLRFTGDTIGFSAGDSPGYVYCSDPGGRLDFVTGGRVPQDSNASLLLLSNLNAIFNGNVGIGTLNPAAKLDVFDGSYHLRFSGDAIGFSAGDSPGYVYCSDPNGRIDFVTGGRVPQDSNASLLLLNNLDAIFNGNIGIGTLTPSAKLEVQGGPIKATGGLIIETRTSDPPSPAVGQIWLRTDL